MAADRLKEHRRLCPGSPARTPACIGQVYLVVCSGGAVDVMARNRSGEARNFSAQGRPQK
jgi:hypothetical protein